MGWRQQADARFTKVLIGPYACIQVPDGKAQIGYKLIGCRAYWPLLIIVDPFEQMGLTGGHSRWYCDPTSCQRFPQPT
jgi:hypothetical protein